MDGLDVHIKRAFCSETAGADWAGVWWCVCVFDQQVACHAKLGCGGPMAQAAQERGRGADH